MVRATFPRTGKPHTGCSKRLSSKAAADESTRRRSLWATLRMLSGQNTLADFFNILISTIPLPESLSSMSIQWFPGHMNTARKEAAKTMEVIDVVVEVLDARIPNASCNPLIEELRLARQRPSLKVLNKADLADPAVTQAWLDLYNRQPGVSAVALSCSHTGDAAKLPQLCQPLAPHRNSSAKPLRMLIMGIPNVGKSTLMNMLLKRRIARVGDEPAVTKSQQRHN